MPRVHRGYVGNLLEPLNTLLGVGFIGTLAEVARRTSGLINGLLQNFLTVVSRMTGLLDGPG